MKELMNLVPKTPVSAQIGAILPALARLFLLGIALIGPATTAMAQVRMTASPAQVTAGAEVRIGGVDAPNTQLRVRLIDPAGAFVAQSPNFFASGGAFATAINVPSGRAPGTYNLQLLNASTGTPVANAPLAPLTILPELMLEIPADPVALGAQFAFTVDGLRPGQLLLRIGGVPIAGPFNVSGPRFEGFAQLPINAATPGALVTLEALNLLGEQRIGYGSTGRFRVASTAVDAQPRLDALQIPGAQLTMNAPWPVSGRLVLPRQSPAGLEARLFLRLPNGRMVPLSQARAPVAPDGSFSVIGDLATLWRNGIRVQTGITGDGFLVFVEPDRGQPGGRGGARFHSFPLGPVVVQDPSASPNPRFTVEVLDASGQPLEDAIVILDVANRWKASLGQPPTTSTTPTSLGETGQGAAETVPRSRSGLTLVSNDTLALRLGSSQIRDALDSLGQEPGSGIGGGQGCPETLQRGTTGPDGRFLAELDLEQLNFHAGLYAVNAGIGFQGSPSDIVHAPVELEFRVLVNALPAGHTFGTSSLNPQGGEYWVAYREETNSFFGWSETAKDYTVPLGKNPVLSFRTRFEFTGGAVYPLLVNLGNLPELVPGRYGPTVTFPDPVAYPVLGPQWLINVTTNEALFGAIDWMRLERLAFGQVVQTWSFGRSSLSCSTDEDVNFRVDVDGARLPHSGPSGLQFRIRVKQQGLPTEQAYTYDFRLRTDPAPTWFDTTDLDQRSVFWSPTLVRMTGSKTRPQQAVSGTPQGAGVGNLSNRSQAVETFSQSLSAGGLTGLVRTTTSSNRGANREAAPAMLSTSQLGIWVPWGPETILDTGSLPLFRMVWGIPPIASATFGADARFWATLEIEARSDIDFDTGVLSASVKTTPTVSGNINAFFDFSAVLGLVSMTASFAPEFSVAMPTVVSNNAPAESRECMIFRIWIRYAVSVGLCPVCVEFSDQGDAFDPLVTPANANWCPTPATPPAGSADRSESRTSLAGLRRPSASFDSLGAGSLVEVGSDGVLRERLWNGSGFDAAQEFGIAIGADEVIQRHFAPGQAVMVYVRSNLTQQQLQASTIEAAAAGRRLRFRLRQANGSWTTSALVATGTAPIGGEGKPALATCPGGEPGCPAGGEAYVAWIRGTDPNPFSLATEIWGARFVNGSWQAAQRLADPGSGSDQLPRVTYLNGQPIVSFVRQPQRSLAATAQRRLMLIQVGVGLQAIDTLAPEGVIWQDISVDPQGELMLAYTVAADPTVMLGSQNWLQVAKGSCAQSSCNFVHTRQRDGFDREIMAESPQLLRTPQGMQIAYRGLGYGPDANGERFRPGDTPGTIDGTGEFMSLVPHFSALANSPPLAVSGNGALHFNPQMIRHPVSGALIGLSSTLSAAQAGSAGLAAQLSFEPGRGAAVSRQLESDLAEFILSDAPDLVLLSATTDAPFAEPGSNLNLRLQIENRGSRPQIPPALGISWGGPWDSGVPQERTTVPAFGASGSQLVELSIPVPAALASRGPQQLYLTLDPFASLPDLDRSNNLLVLDVGTLPVPEALRFFATPGERHALVEWDVAEDERVRGFQVYREFAPGDWQPIGASPVTGFVDLMTEPNISYRYRIASYDENGAESALSEPLTVQALRTNLIFQSRFERP